MARKLITADEFRREAAAGRTPSATVCKLYTPEIGRAPMEPEAEGAVVLQFVISTGDVDRMGDTIAPRGWDLKQYKKNPVVLWAHNSGELPVAKSRKTWIEDDKLKSIQEFAAPDLYPFGHAVGQMYQRGFLSAQSVGFNPREFKRSEDEEERPYGLDFTKQELLETSAVPVPANPFALVEARKSGIDTVPILNWAEALLDLAPPEGHAELRGAARGMQFGVKFLEAIRKMADPVERVIFTFPGEAKALEIEVEPDAPALELSDGEETPEPVEEETAPEGGGTADPAATPGEEQGSVEIVPEGDGDGGEAEPLTVDLAKCEGPISYARAHPQGCAIARKNKPFERAAPNEAQQGTAYNPNVKRADTREAATRECAISDALCHHEAGPLAAVNWQGVKDAMRALMMGAPSHLPSEERRTIYDHLAAHYREFGETAPEWALIEARICDTLSAQAVWDDAAGTVRILTAADAAKAHAERAIGQALAALDAVESKTLEQAGMVERFAAIRAALTDTRKGAGDSGASESDGGEGLTIEIEDRARGIEIDDAALVSIVAEETGKAVREALRARTGRLD